LKGLWLLTIFARARRDLLRHPGRGEVVIVMGALHEWGTNHELPNTQYGGPVDDSQSPRSLPQPLHHASPGHEAAFDEFITQAPPPSEEVLRLETRTEQFVRACLRRERPPSIILTGNAGDGKTYLCRRIVEAFTGKPVTDWADRLDWPIQRDNFTLRVVKNLSEVEEERAANLLYELALDQLEARPCFAFLIAANEGRLRVVLQRERLNELYAEVDRQLRGGPDLTNRHHRRSIRLRGWDYTRPGAYFVTIVTHRREVLFGEVVDGEMVLSEWGRIVEEEWQRTAVVRPYVRLDAFVVMPNHIHGIIWIVGDDAVGAQVGARVGAQRRVTRRRGVPLTSRPDIVPLAFRRFDVGDVRRANGFSVELFRLQHFDLLTAFIGDTPNPFHCIPAHKHGLPGVLPSYAIRPVVQVDLLCPPYLPYPLSRG